MPFFEFDQNNSGGWFDKDDERGIGPRVWIEAMSKDNAVLEAKRLGIYFNGVSDAVDCGGCGDRWYEPDEGDAKEKRDQSKIRLRMARHGLCASLRPNH